MKYKGISIYIYGNDHNPPHVHIMFAEYDAIIDISTRELIEGKFPRNKLKIIIGYIEDNEDYLITTFYERNPNLRR